MFCAFLSPFKAGNMKRCIGVDISLIIFASDKLSRKENAGEEKYTALALISGA